MAFDCDVTFWNQKSRLNDDYQRLYARLVPSTGKCNTVEGELLRASSRIYHDYYNNGFGNNWSGAFNFLDAHLGLKKTERKLLKGYAKGRIRQRLAGMYTSDDKLAATLEGLAERVVQHCLAVERSNTFTPNTEDLFDLQEKGW